MNKAFLENLAIVYMASVLCRVCTHHTCANQPLDSSHVLRTKDFHGLGGKKGEESCNDMYMYVYIVKYISKSRSRTSHYSPGRIPNMIEDTVM